MRPKKRYIVFEVISEHPVKYGDLVSAFWSQMLGFFGENEASAAGIWFMQDHYSDKKQSGVVKCRHVAVEQVRLALSLIQVAGESRAIARIRGVTGTLKSAETKYLGDSE